MPWEENEYKDPVHLKFHHFKVSFFAILLVLSQAAVSVCVVT